MLPSKEPVVVGNRYRALVRCPEGGLCEASCRAGDTHYAIFIDPTPQLEGGREHIVVFTVESKSMFHTETTADGSHDWFEFHAVNVHSTRPADAGAPVCGP